MTEPKNLYDELRLDRITYLKAGSLFSRLKHDAITAVLASIDTQRGRGVNINNNSILDIIKKEIKVFRESQSHDKQYLEDCEFKANFLENTYIPEQASKEKLYDMFNYFISHISANAKVTPKAFMDYLDNEMGLAGHYDKSMASGIVLGKVK